jgi:excinuclease ABC subunit C
VVLAPAQAGGPDELEALSAWLSEQRGARVRLSVPRRGVPARLVRMATENAGEAFRVRLATTRTLSARLERLQRRLSLGRLPARIECFDMSTSGGRFSVGAMAVLIDGEPAPAAYRRFKIKQAAPDSDVGMMREVVSRRFRPVLEGEEEGPDLVVVDGGRGQLNAVGALFADLGVSDVDLVGLAKFGPGAGRHKADRDRVFVPGRVNPVQLRPDSDELFLLSRVRDEAHRFAIGYHRKLQRKAGVRSVLDDISGVGPVLRKRLLTHFGGLRGVKRADPESLRKVPGVSARLAERIHNLLKDLADH